MNNPNRSFGAGGAKAALELGPGRHFGLRYGTGRGLEPLRHRRFGAIADEDGYEAADAVSTRPSQGPESCPHYRRPGQL